MAGATHSLCGFASGVNWRPIKFQECLLPVRICGLCGIVPDTIALLPCSHLLCEFCFRGCADGEGPVCPIDEESFRVEDEVTWITPSRRHLSKMQAFCWNTENGCDFVGPVEKLLQHFEQECSFHTISCPRCHDAVLRKDVRQHSKAGCAELKSLPRTIEEEVLSSSNDALLLENVTSSCSHILASIETRVNELVEGVNKMSLGLLGSREPRQAGIVEAQLQEVVQSVRNLFDKTQGSSASVPLATRSAEMPTFGITKEVTSRVPAEDLFVLSYAFEKFRYDGIYRNRCTQDTFTVSIRGEVTNVEIQCMISREAEFISVSAKLTEPGKWCLPDIEPLSSNQLCPTSLSGVVYRDVDPVYDFQACLQQGYILRCICKLPSRLFEEDRGKKQLIFLVKMKLSDSSN